MSPIIRRLVVSGFFVAILAALLAVMGGAAHAQAVSPNLCSGEAAFTDPLAGPHWNGWGAGPLRHRFQSGEMAGLDADDVPDLELKWAFGLPGVSRAYGQPAVAGGRLFFGTETGTVYALDADAGCIYWTFEAESPVRTAVSVGPLGGGHAVYFGDQGGMAYAVDAASGELVWSREVEAHPLAAITGAPTLAGGRLYVPASSGEEAVGGISGNYPCCTFRGSVSALDAATGEVVWKGYTTPGEPRPTRKNKLGVQLFGPSGASVWSSPSVDLEGGRVYVTTSNSYSDPAASTSDAFVAFDLETGDLLWSRQMTAGDARTIDCDFPEELKFNCPEEPGPDFDFGSSPLLMDLPGGGQALIAGQKSGLVHAVDPENGEILWQTRIGQGGGLGGIQWGMATDGVRVYAAVSDVLPVPAADPAEGQPTLLGVNMSLDPDTGGGLFALDPATGDIVWETPHPGCNGEPDCSPAQSAAVTVIPGVVLSGGLDGHLRAYSTGGGGIVWDVNTKRDYDTVNGVEARGGSIDSAGPVVVDGVLYVNSGYTFVGHTPGNALLAFSVGAR